MMATKGSKPVALAAMTKASAEKFQCIDAILAVAILNDVVWGGNEVISIKAIKN